MWAIGRRRRRIAVVVLLMVVFVAVEHFLVVVRADLVFNAQHNMLAAVADGGQRRRPAIGLIGGVSTLNDGMGVDD